MVPLVERLLARSPPTQPLSIHDRLSDVGLSSISMVNLMLAVEAEFDVTIPQDDITPDNFRSIETIETLILKLTGQPAERS